jgi:tetratricopeptide (TPR) repeat protein
MIGKILLNLKYKQWIIFFTSFILYANTIPNDYALDDLMEIGQNVYVQKGLKGIKEILANDTFTGFFKQKKDLVQGGRYRPLSLVTFAVEQSMWKNNPHISHLINALLYGLLCVVLYFTLKSILEYIDRTDLSVPVAFISTLLFAVHPVHTEVVANIKGRDEILSLLFGLLALYYFLQYTFTNRLITAFWSGIFLFLGLFSKENSITIPFIVVTIIWLNYNKKIINRYIIGFLFFISVIIVYLFIRSYVNGVHSTGSPSELMNNPFLYADNSQRLATVFYTLLLYLKLLVFPHPLTYDYYPYHISLQNWGNPLVIFSLLLYLFLLFFSFYSLFKQKQKIPAFAVLIYLITILPLSNMFINTGSFMNERFVFFGSIGFCVFIAYGLYFIIEKTGTRLMLKNAATIIFLTVLIIFSMRVFIRNTDWKDNYTLFLHDVKISSGSAKGNVTAGGILLEKAAIEVNEKKKKEYLNQSVTYLEMALKIYPNYVDALLLAGNAIYQRDKNLAEVDGYYNRLFKLAPGYELAFNNYKIMLASAREPEIKKEGYLKILSYLPNDFESNYQLGSTYGKLLNNMDSAIIFLVRAVQIRPESKDANRDLGVAYAIKGDIEKSIPFFEKTIELDPNDPSNYINLGISYQKMGYSEKAREEFLIAKRLQGGK